MRTRSKPSSRHAASTSPLSSPWLADDVALGNIFEGTEGAGSVPADGVATRNGTRGTHGHPPPALKRATRGSRAVAGRLATPCHVAADHYTDRMSTYAA